VRAGAGWCRVAGGALPGGGGLSGLDHLPGYLVVGLGGLQAPLAGGAGLAGAVGARLGPVQDAVIVSAAEVKTLLAALDDAAEYKRDRAETCADCVGQSCTTCQWRLQAAAVYDQMAGRIIHAAEAFAARQRAPGHAAPPSSGPHAVADKEAGQ